MVPREDARRLDTLGAAHFSPETLNSPWGMKEKCGVVGVHSSYPISIKYLLLGLQHRGQQSTGMLFWERTRNKWSWKGGLGLVSEVFNPPRASSRMEFSAPLEDVKETIGLGHNRYGTAERLGGVSSKTRGNMGFSYNIQPIVRGNVGYAHNGTIANYRELRKEVGTMWGDTDTEVVALLVADELHKGKKFVDAFRAIEPRLQGSYSMTALVEENGKSSSSPVLYGMRGPLGNRPLKFARLELEGEHIGHLFVSEDCTLENSEGLVNAVDVRDVEPGEIVRVDDHEVTSYRHSCPRESFCFFEGLYFMRPKSTIKGRSVSSIRQEMGARVAERVPHIDEASCVPDSGRPMALGAARRRGVPYTEVFDKNKYAARTFIMSTAKERLYWLNVKLGVIEDAVEGKDVLLCDDSIVRSLTAGVATKKLKKAGARKVYWAISSPPIISPCYLGMDYPTYEELGVHDYLREHSYDPWKEGDVDAVGEWMAQRVGADGVYYAYLQDVEAVLPMGKCLGCITDSYPIEVPEK